MDYPQSSDNPIGLSIAAAVKASGIGRSTLYEAIADGHLPAKKLGRRTIVLQTDLRDWLERLPRLVPSRLGGG